MRKIFQITIFCFFIFCSIATSLAQEKVLIDNNDISFKEQLYLKYKKEVLSYNKKEFDALFFEFFQKQSDQKIQLNKEEFYTYTIKIAIYSEKLGLLYKNQKVEAQQSKDEWFNKNYSEYLKSKK